ncbi:MAG: Uma2 family endonuclease [Okeania sp. SIO2G4]|uniref:Uma2 family endonuclease n=1 Tax=unclassified Okeania TaxID=2634635 RepID=UPI0013B91385|nr:MULTISPECIES: Uma2 family endonuclease [unclassified Okeania]NEP05139.1 Uma2 family endonuclease [Okeania sp. SIO4D6]NEP41789.1 Uma2 family endonuclease [Okeania sp. SIO2H7]NEP74626.1 Uma2 family endonuclease [Okeania sp. SIO2G5]NEP95708.1 Uma2 family endonuclease [Okeania sp. SIO2F5]NEQ93429.1 Uma2 family endonuclease [Okeania sp. SIO2G4]
MSVQLLRRLFTVDQYYKMLEAGVFTENERVELIRGEIITMSPMGIRHAGCVNRLNELFFLRLAQTVTVGIQIPVRLNNNSEPEPDISLLQRRPDFYETQQPQPENVFLLIEVSDTTVKYDQEVKIPLYAENNIVEVWLVNLTEECLEVYRQPTANGYEIVQTFQRGETLSIQALPNVTFTVDEILGD